jgi:predicted O-methyltransferase YrrM
MFWKSSPHRQHPAPESLPENPDEWIRLAEADPRFREVYSRFAGAGVMNWLTEREKALHFGIAAFSAGSGVIVELGTFEGGAAIFLAAGVARRGRGRVVSVDPHCGGPPWLGMAPHQRTLSKFIAHAGACGVREWIDARIGDSSAVAAVWPGEPIDVVFIDGDHSFLGALKDFECWAPKVRPGGWVLIDDADDTALPELLELIEELKVISGVKYMGLFDGVAVFRREDVPPQRLLADVSAFAQRRGDIRPWDMSPVHEMLLPPSYCKSCSQPHEPGEQDAYQLAFLTKAQGGTYGFTPAAGDRASRLIRAVAADRGDGPATELDTRMPQACKVIFCALEEVAVCSSWLTPGGLMLTLNPATLSQETSIGVRRAMLDAGLEGCGWGGGFHWGIRRPFLLSAEAVMEYTKAAYLPGASAPTRD